ncbi:inorganic phosphate transporter [Paenibacillus silvisoli]|uniref:inorganic phosphate transporter n=1 Tax=Paenibacillus silvisoli TaxID=3110539 RepID=UPI002805CCC7|nr:anion permease [Paenibacillus silvisoli]
MMLTISLIVAFFFAMNIGASGTAASMGAAYGGGAINRKWIALVLAAVSVFLGAYLGGGEVVKTISQGIIPSDLLTVELTITIIAAACLTLFIANMMAVPLSTSEVTVGSIIGVGVVYNQLYLGKILFIVSAWIILPFLAFLISYLLGKAIQPIELLLQKKNSKRITYALTSLLIIAGCLEAFSAGMNNIANAVGPLVGANLISSSSAILWGGLFVALGVLLLGGGVLETNAKKITQLSLLKSSVVSLTAGTLVVIASLFGIPVPLTQATTMGILGVGTVNDGKAIWKSDTVKKVIKVWILSPISSLVVSYLLVEIIIRGNYYLLLAVICAGIVFFGYRGLKKYQALKRNSKYKIL